MDSNGLLARIDERVERLLALTQELHERVSRLEQWRARVEGGIAMIVLGVPVATGIVTALVIRALNRVWGG